MGWIGSCNLMDGREEGTLIDALLFEFVRAQILFMDLRLQAR